MSKSTLSVRNHSFSRKSSTSPLQDAPQTKRLILESCSEFFAGRGPQNQEHGADHAQDVGRVGHLRGNPGRLFPHGLKKLLVHEAVPAHLRTLGRRRCGDCGF